VSILAAVLAFLVCGVAASTWGDVNSTLGFTGAQKASIAMWQAIGLMAGSISVGPFIDRKGRKAGLLAGLALISISLGWLANAQGGYYALLILAAVLGVGGGAVVTGANALVSDIGQLRRGAALNLLSVFFVLGALAGPLVSASILGGAATRMCYLAAAVAAGTLAVAAAVPMPKPAGASGFKVSEISSVAVHPALGLLALLLFLYFACEAGVWNWLVKYLTDVRKVDQTTARQILLLGFPAGLVAGRLVVSRILVNIAALQVTLGAAITMALSTFWVLQSTSPAAAWVAVFCAGMAMAPMFPTALALVGDTFPRLTATAMGITIACGWLGMAAGPPVIGRLAASSGLETALLGLPALSVAMVVVNLALRPVLSKGE
jgi:fucose permease